MGLGKQTCRATTWQVKQQGHVCTRGERNQRNSTPTLCVLSTEGRRTRRAKRDDRGGTSRTHAPPPRPTTMPPTLPPQTLITGGGSKVDNTIRWIVLQQQLGQQYPHRARRDHSAPPSPVVVATQNKARAHTGRVQCRAHGRRQRERGGEEPHRPRESELKMRHRERERVSIVLHRVGASTPRRSFLK